MVKEGVKRISTSVTPYRNRYGFYNAGPLLFFQSNLEKAGIAMRHALKSVQYYSPRYAYYVDKSNNRPIINEKGLYSSFQRGNSYGI